jgi:hypothetical protein
MKKKRITIWLMCMVVALVACILFAADEPAKVIDKTRVIVGTFDSRAVALVALEDPPLRLKFERMHPEYVAPRDGATPEEVEQWKINLRKRQFRQGFGRGNVSEFLDLIKDEIPKIAKEAGVDVIVSKWDIEYQSPKVKLVDVTEALIQPFKPTDERLKIIRDVMEAPAATEKEIREREKREGIY